MIGKKFKCPIPMEELNDFNTCMNWCNETGQGYLECFGDYYECVEVLPGSKHALERELMELEDWFAYNPEQILDMVLNMEIPEAYSEIKEKALRIKEIREQLDA